MPPLSTFRDWSYILRVDNEPGGKVSRYTINFYRHVGEWYDEIRYDSHDQKRGRTVLAPHFHMKVSSRFKPDTGKAIEEIKEIIDNYLKGIGEVLER